MHCNSNNHSQYVHFCLEYLSNQQFHWLFSQQTLNGKYQRDSAKQHDARKY